MKNLIAMSIFLFLNPSLKATNTPEAETLNVMAFSGLKIRTAPNIHGEVLKVIPFGQVIQVLERSGPSQTIERIEGQWIKIKYQGTEGFVFDGFLSNLPLPIEDFELTTRDNDLAYPLISWTQFRFDEIMKSDTIQSSGTETINQYYNDSVVLTRQESPYHLKVTIELPQSNLAEAYNLIKSMLLTKEQRQEFDHKTIYINDHQNSLEKIKVRFEKPVSIEKLPNGGVKINAITYYGDC